MKRHQKQLIVASIICILVSMAGYFIAPIEIRFLNQLTSNTVLVGLTYALGAIFFGLSALFLGRMSDKFGRKNFILIGCILGIIYPLFYATTVNIFQYMGIKLAWAISAVATGPIIMAYIQDLLKKTDHPGQYIGIVFSLQSIFGAVAQFLGGYLSDRYGLMYPYLAMSIVFFLATVIALYQSTLRDTGAKKKVIAGVGRDTELVRRRKLFFGIKYVFGKSALIFYFIHNIAFSLNWGIKAMLWPLIIFSMTGKDVLTGSILATMGVVAAILLLFVGKFVDRVGVFKSATISFLFLGVSGIFLVLTNNINIFWLAAIFFAIGESIYGPMHAVLLTQNVDSKYRGEILGIDSMFSTVTGTIAPFLAGFFLRMFSARQVLLMFICIIWLSLVIGYFFYRRKILSNVVNKKISRF